MDISKVEISGPCRITANGVDMGHTLDGVELSAERTLTDVVVDRYGDTPIDKVLGGNRMKITFKLAQNTWTTWNLAMPETSSHDGSAANDRIDFGADAGYSLRADAVLLVIHPLKNLANDFSEDVTIYKAISSESLTLPMRIDEQAAVEITMEALVDEAYGTGRRLGHFGPAAVS